MQIRVSGRNGRLFLRALAGVVFSGAATLASAQTTVTLNQPAGTQVVAATVRGGSFATKSDSSVLATRASDNVEYRRRGLLKFDTQNTIPAGSSVTSATLTLTVKEGSSDASRSIGVYQVTTSWTEGEVSWNRRKTGTSWNSAGGDLGSKLDDAVVSNSAGAKVTFDVTPLVKEAVAGRLGSSRYTRLALVDLEGSTSASYREYYLPNDGNVANRPVLKVTYGGTSTSTTPPAPSPTPSTTTSTSTLKVLHWNSHHNGLGTDGKRDVARFISKAASFRPDVVSFNEVETYNPGGPAEMLLLMKKYTGQTWYSKFGSNSGTSSGQGNLVMSRFPIIGSDVQTLSYNRVIVNITISVNGRNVNVSSTHLDQPSSSYRLKQIAQLMTWGRSTAEQRIICGDFNTQSTTYESVVMKGDYYDSWAKAQAAGTATAYPGNTAGNTRNSRIDYIYYSDGATALVLKSSQVFDVRDANGVMPSDHRPLMTTFTVK
jgi:endonuclease/exonuclease/phosphatase family metal-dependent hydrolase